MKKHYIACSALVLALLAGGAFVASNAEARGCPYMGGAGAHAGHYADITDEQRAAARTIAEEGQAKIRPLRDQMFVKRQELEALKSAGNPDVQAVGKKAEELVALHQQLRDAEEKLGLAIDKTLGLPEGTHSFGGKGYGRGYGGGHGGGHGMGHERGGHGMGHERGGHGMHTTN